MGKENTMKNKGQVVVSLALSAMLACSGFPAALAQSNPQTTTEVTQAEIDHAQTSMQIAKEGVVLLENNNNALPFAKEGKVALFGIGAIQTTKGGTGSGAVNNRIVYADGTVVEGEAIATSVLDGFTNAGYDVITKDYLVALDEANPHDTTGLGMGRSDLADDTALTEVYSEDELKAMAAETDTAFYTIRRNAGEGADRVIENDYELSANELANIKTLSATFDKVVVLLNVVNVDASWFAESGADALVLISNPGELGGDAIVSVLNGETNPSGKLVDTWAKSIYDWPSTKYYSNINPDDPWEDEVEFYYEDVFVGYRYFDTYNADAVQYEFGYGLSYTTFDIKVDEVTADADNVTVKATVTNTGDVAGKEVVQVYFSAPDGTLLKPYQELAAYGKTDELAPGESQTLTISYQTSEMSSYSEEKAAYILEAGDYTVRVGNSSRNTTPAAVITLDAEAITEQLQNKVTMDRGGVYPGGSAGDYDNVTTEDNIANYNKLAEEFAAENDKANGLQAPDTENAVKLTLAAADIKTSNPYEEKGVDGKGTVTGYVSATTDESLIGTKGYDYATNTEYTINTVYFDADGNAVTEKPETMADYSGASLKDVAEGKITIEQFVSGLTTIQMADIVEGGSKSPNANGQSSGGKSPSTDAAGQDVADYIDSVYIDGGAGQTAGLYAASKGIPSMTNADGPAGLRISQSYTGLDGNEYYQYCTAYPVGIMIAQTWNTDLAYTMGQNVGQEMLQYGVSQWLAPGMNIHRNPLCGRNFEYYSEDPVVAGMTGGYETLGVQSNKGVGVTLKHFTGNEQENSRNSQNDVVTERAFREIYLKQFEIAVKMANPMGMMSTYGIVNGVPSANDHDIQQDILRTEWGFTGVEMTDWGGSGGMRDFLAMHSGNDLIMAGKDVNANIMSYIVDVEPVITYNEDGVATDGGYPRTVATTTTWGTWIWKSISTDWGDYKLDANGTAWTVKATADSFNTTEVATLVSDENGNSDFVYVTVKELIESLSAEGTASYVDNGDGTVTITYMLSQVSTSDSTHYSAAYKEHAATVGTNMLGEEDYNPLSLADLQKATINILNVLMHTNQFEELTGVTVGTFTDADAVVPYYTVSK